MNEKCPWCGSENLKLFLELKDYFLTEENFMILCCDECKLLFTSPVPSAEAIGNYYKSENYLSHNENRKGLLPWIYNIVKQRNVVNKFDIAVADMANGSLLDIGCGVGDFLFYAANRGWNISGIEPDLDAKSVASNKLHLKIDSPDALPTLPDDSFDVVTMWHVLEHVRDLKSEIFHLQRIVRHGGRLIIALPNYKSFDAMHYLDKWAAYDVPRHLYHFSKESVAKIFNDTVFSLTDIKPLKWDSYYVSVLSEKYCGSFVPLLKGIWYGLKSNLIASKSMQYSSLVYCFVKDK